MGQVFTSKVDVAKLKEGALAFVQTAMSGRLFGVLAKDVAGGWWLCTDALENTDAAESWGFVSHGKKGFLYAVKESGDKLTTNTLTLEIIDADPTEKMQAEHVMHDKRAQVFAADMARDVRLLACEKACDGFDDPMELRRQRDDLLAALIEYVAQDYIAHDNDAGIGGGTQDDAEAAIAKATE